MKTCLRCGKELSWTGRSRRRKYCSYKCSNAHHDYVAMAKLTKGVPRSLDPNSGWFSKRPIVETERLRMIARIGGIRSAQRSRRRSKGEESLARSLREIGHKVEQGVWTLVDGHEVDIYLPDIKTAISYNGPVHYNPVYGEVRLKQVVARDAYRDRKLREMGIRHVVVRETKRFSLCRAAEQFKWCLAQLRAVAA